MKKFLLSLVMLLSVVSVNASTGSSVSNIKIEEVKIITEEKVGYSEEIKVSYSITPRDAENLNLTWEVKGVKKGITVEFISSNKTSTADGEIIVKVDNTKDEEVTLTLNAKQKSKVLAKTDIVVESKNDTVSRVTEEVENLILNLNEKTNNNTYDDNLKIVEEVEELLDKYPEVTDSIDSELLEKYEMIKVSVEEYEPTNNKAFIIGVLVILLAVFSTMIFWIFKKED